jgi:hypothetical protein
MTGSSLWGRFGQLSSPEDMHRYKVAYEAAKAADDTARYIRLPVRDAESDQPAVLVIEKAALIRALAERDHQIPKGFSFVLACLAKPNRADEVLGDAEAEYRGMITRLGVSRARWWFRVYVIKVALGMVPGVLMRLVVLHKLFSSF